MTKLTKQVSEFISRRKPAPAQREGVERRAEPRWIPEGEKTVTVSGDIVATVRDESQGGACLKMPAETDVTMGQKLTVEDDKCKKVGRVCWTTVDNFGSHRLVGLAWVKK